MPHGCYPYTLVSLFLCLPIVACQGDTSSPGAGSEPKGGWFAGGDATNTPDGASRDARPAPDIGPDPTPPEDAGRRDVSPGPCADLDQSRRRCERRSDCEWHIDPCAEDPGAGSCVASGTPSGSRCDPRIECSNVESESKCDRLGTCKWASKSCPGGELAMCVAAERSDPLPRCPEPDRCAQRAPERCQTGECELETPGCGEDRRLFDSPTCLPTTPCKDDDQCDADESCEPISLQPDCERCGACSTTERRCVPDEWLEKSGSCRDLGRDACRKTERCRMLWPKCNQKAPDGVKTYDQPTCLPDVTCGGVNPGTCPPAFTCETVWEGCGPTEYCLRCGAKAKRCVPVGGG